MKKIIFVISFLLVIIGANAQQKWTLQQCIDTALNNNRNIKQRAIARKTSEIAYQQARLNLLPNLNASASQGWSFGRSQMVDGTYQNVNSSNTSFNLSAGITLFDGLRMKYNIDQRMMELKASDAYLSKIKEDIILSVSTAYLQILQNKELVTVANNQLLLTQNKIENQRALVSAGKMAEGEMYELYAQESKEQLNKIQAENNLQLAILDLAQILELSNFDKFDVEIPQELVFNELSLFNVDKIYQNALNNRPEVKMAEYQLKSGENGVKLAKSSFYPSLSFGANMGGGVYNSVNTPLNTSIGFNLSIPLFNKLETVNQVKTAKLSAESNRLSLDNTKIELRKTVQQAYMNTVAAKARWDAAIKSEQAGKESYRFTNQKFENGRATVYELYQAKSNLTQAESEVVQAKYEYFFRLKILELLQ